MLDPIESLLATILAALYDFVPSFGIAIILLTITINVVLFPLTLKQTRATRAMQEIQPHVKKIQAEFKDDPQEMQKRLMQLQRESGATPGGCLLPLLVQMPIWFALFRVLNNIAAIAHGTADVVPELPSDSALLAAVQAGDTSFLGMSLGMFMKDGIRSGFLSGLPYVVMIVLMVVSQYLQQWHAQYGQKKQEATTAQQRQAQQTQQAITKIMPLFIGFFSWNFPAGLVLYWATSNVFRLGQQFLIFAIDGRPTPPSAVEKRSDGGSSEGGETVAKKPHPVSEKKRRRRRR